MVKCKKLVSVFMSVSLLTLAGCGQKGPLYLAEQDQVESNQPKQQTDADKEQKEQQ
ncbi:lipoprotein [Pseudoalteromonas sp. XMcav1-K]|uniref:LPS translocon maturation chaperone LptM n=1 Tax=Pseudoalteromonas sp. XMcav1-K TaxID=3374372 RepID=UPI003756572A